MTLRHLTIFRAVCQTESITLAAEHLNMTQPAVSLAVRELEDFYGVQLFERMNRRIYITEAGRTLLQYADTILSQYAESVQVLQEARHRGSCRFGVHVTFGETVLPSLLRRLAEQLPYITVRAFVTNTRENEEMLLREKGSGTRDSSDTVFGTAGLTVSAFLDSSSTYALLSCAREGLGVTILPRSLTAEALREGTLKELTVTDGAFFRR